MGLAPQADEHRARHRAAPTCRTSPSASYAGPDLGLLCATGKVKKAIYPFCSLDSIALEPHFRNARQSGAVQTLELDEGMFLLGLQAAAWRVPFLPTRVGLGSFVVDRQPEIKTVMSPYDDGEELVAAPALNLDVAIIHMHRGDARGNGQYLNVDPYMDDLVAMAAPTAFMSVEQRASPPTSSRATGPCRRMLISRLMTHGVVEAPKGAHFTECVPDYGARRGVPEGVRREREGPRRCGRRGRRSTSTAATTPSTGRWSGCERHTQSAAPTTA